MSIHSTVTVSDLIDILKKHDPEAYVLFSSNYGDHMNTQQVMPIETVDAEDARHLYSTGYSDSGWAFDEDRPEPDPEDEEYDPPFTGNIVLLR